MLTLYQWNLANLSNSETLIKLFKRIKYKKGKQDGIFIPEIGDGWAPTILDNEEEYNFLKEAMGLFISSYDTKTFIGGSFQGEHCWIY